MMRVLTLFIFILLFNATASAESLSDINTERLSRTAKQAWGRDPFIKYGQKDEKRTDSHAADALKIGGIISDGTKAMAIINGSFYRVGNRVDDYRIVDISNERILLEKNGKKYSYSIEKFALEGGKK